MSSMFPQAVPKPRQLKQASYWFELPMRTASVSWSWPGNAEGKFVQAVPFSASGEGRDGPKSFLQNDA